VREGDEISPFYDPMIAKLIVWAPNREQALAKLDLALQDYHLDGIHTNIDFLRRLATLDDFADAKLHTGIIEQHQNHLLAPALHDEQIILAMAGLVFGQQAQNQYGTLAGLRLNQPLQLSSWTIAVEYLNNTIEIATNTQGSLGIDHLVLQYTSDQHGAGQHKAGYCLKDDKLNLFTPQGKAVVTIKTPSIDDFVANNEANTGGIKAPMNGSLIAVLVTTGQQVLAGDALMVVEAMKMEHTITAPYTGVVGEIYFKVGHLVDAESQLLELNEEDA